MNDLNNQVIWDPASDFLGSSGERGFIDDTPAPI
jgi:hypothetical protein